ncbi:MAG: hypothetical protein KF894_25865 [Labilithrix sp.]|nr:hypothetical protein [Labilithrix sp.]
MKHKLAEMTRDAQESAERARKLREHLEEATANVDGLVGEARSTLRRAVEFLEREGLRGAKSGAYARFTGVAAAERPAQRDERRRAPKADRAPSDAAPTDHETADGTTRGE